MGILEIKGSTALVGDIHGSYDDYDYTRPDVDNLVFLGDIGFGFFKLKYFCDNLNKEIPEGYECYFIRGNHDDPSIWKNCAESISQYVPRFHMIQDYDIVIIHGKKYLCIGGGISIDRHYRIDGITYWLDEFITPPPDDLDVTDIYGFLSHAGITPPVVTHKNDYIEKFPDIKSDVMKEQELLKRIYNTYKPKVWYNGHFHVHCEFDYEDCKIIQLNCNEPYILQ